MSGVLVPIPAAMSSQLVPYVPRSSEIVLVSESLQSINICPSLFWAGLGRFFGIIVAHDEEGLPLARRAFMPQEGGYCVYIRP